MVKFEVENKLVTKNVRYICIGNNRYEYFDLLHTLIAVKEGDTIVTNEKMAEQFVKLKIIDSAGHKRTYTGANLLPEGIKLLDELFKVYPKVDVDEE